MSAVYGAASGTLEVVKTTTWLTTGSPHTTIGSRHDKRTRIEVAEERDSWKEAYEKLWNNQQVDCKVKKEKNL